jgi:hypothetical protein
MGQAEEEQSMMRLGRRTSLFPLNYGYLEEDAELKPREFKIN